MGQAERRMRREQAQRTQTPIHTHSIFATFLTEMSGLDSGEHGDMGSDWSLEMVQRGQNCLDLDRIHESATEPPSEELVYTNPVTADSRSLQKAQNQDAIYKAYSRPEVCAADVESIKRKWQAAAVARADARNLSDGKLPESSAESGESKVSDDSEASFSSTLQNMERLVSTLSDFDPEVASPLDPQVNSEAQEPHCATYCQETTLNRAVAGKSCSLSRTKVTEIAAPASSPCESISGDTMPIHAAENKRARMDTQQTLTFNPAESDSGFNMILSEMAAGSSAASLNRPLVGHCTRQHKLCSSMDPNLPADDLEAFLRLQREQIRAMGQRSEAVAPSIMNISEHFAKLNCNLHSPFRVEMRTSYGSIAPFSLADESTATNGIQRRGRVRRRRLPIGHNIDLSK